MQSLDIKTKRLESQDVKVAVKIAKSFEGTYFIKEALADIARSLKSDFAYTALFDNKIVGFACFKPVNKGVIELVWMAVLKDVQNKGAGTLLIQKAVSEFKGKYRFLKVKTLAPTSNYVLYKKTRKFYENNGFIPIEIIENYPGWDADSPCLIMIKSI